MKFPNSYFEGEVREGFFVASMMKRAWAAQIEVLLDVEKVCEKYQIPWFADYGTLLGAVRHHGYIPWDDDLDICMKREDYNRFLAVAEKELPEGYFVHNIYTDENYSEMFTRVLNSSVISFEKEFLEKFHGCPYGMGIDIFVMDYIAPSLKEETMQFEIIQTIMEMVGQIDAGATEQEAMAQWADWVCRTFGVTPNPARSFRNQLLQLAEKIFSLYSEREAEELTVMQLWMKNRERRMPKSYYQSTVMLPFENMQVPVPAVYDAVLLKKYGEYMEQVRNGGAHDYPFYRKQEIALQKKTGVNPYAYTAVKEDLKCSRNPGKAPLRKQVRECLHLMEKLHGRLTACRKKDTEEILELLSECQKNAIALGTLIENTAGQRTDAVRKLEEYCEIIYQIYQDAAYGRIQDTDIEKELGKCQKDQIKSCIEKEIDLRYEAVFLPYKAAAWDALESVFLAAKQDPDCKAYVIPVPYFYKNADGSTGNMQYEADLFPKDVPVTEYDTFDFKNHCPDVIYIQNPYDAYDPAVTVHPFFYSKNLKNYTENLVYIPPFLTDEIALDDERAKENIRYCCLTPGVVWADHVIVQSEGMRKIYIDILTEAAGEETREVWEKKILSLGSPKMDKTVAVKKEDMDVPKEWLQIIKKPDGNLKKTVLYGTSAAVLLHSKEEALDKIKSVLAVFKDKKDTVALIWEPDQWTGERMEAEQSDILEKYHELLQTYQAEKWGILDVSGNMERAVLLCDAYYGDRGCLAQMCLKKNIPVMIADVRSATS